MLDNIEQIRGEDLVYRRILRQHLEPNGRVHRSAYYWNGQPDPHASVDLARLTTPEASAAQGRRPGTGIGSLAAQWALNLDLTVRHAPKPDWRPHSLIEVITTKTRCRLLAEATEVVIRPSDR